LLLSFFIYWILSFSCVLSGCRHFLHPSPSSFVSFCRSWHISIAYTA
jgi:hypothetical protein